MPTPTPAPASPHATALQTLLDSIRQAARHESEKGALFERLVIDYLGHEPRFSALYARVQPYASWAKEQSQWVLSPNDTGIDLVATTHTGEHHAVQCKCYAPDHVISKPDIDSFIAASGHRAFSARLLIDTTNKPLGGNAEQTLRQQQIPTTRINLETLEASAIDWARYAPAPPAPPSSAAAPASPAAVFLKPKNQPRPHQQAAIADVLNGLRENDRGKLIMACGSGKTFTALRIAEATAAPEGHILFLVPSLALLSQTLTEWTQQSTLPITAFAVCSDTEVGSAAKHPHADDGERGDRFRLAPHELAYPATTRAATLAKEHAARRRPASLSVIFSTYHSLGVIEQAQREHGLPPFDLVICDEAHRTTGQTWEGDDESTFVRIHDDTAIRATKRLYMTATPRIYDAEAQLAQKTKDLTLYSMDDEAIYGPTLHTLSFSAAVEQQLLVPYKVIVLTVEESEINERIQRLLTDENNSLRLDDAAKIIGCFKALTKEGLTDLSDDIAPMRRAVAFCQIIDRERNTNTRKGSKTAAKQIAEMFAAVVSEYQSTARPEEKATQPSLRLRCEADYVHGGMGAAEKTAKIDWLKNARADDTGTTCRILTNVRCLSEGVDVPALDAVLFLSPRNSQVEVVQSVGRVMRRAPGKQRGYIILPVVIPHGVEPHKALNDNKTYRVVWQVLQALRAHDDEFDRYINRIELLGSDPQRIEVIAVTGLATRKRGPSGEDKLVDTGPWPGIGNEPPAPPDPSEQTQIRFPTGELERAILAKVVQKVGNRDHWQQWAQDIGRIAQLQISRINAIIANPHHTAAIDAFEQFRAQLHRHINTSVSQDEIVEMLAQHLITKPVFDALFGGDHFTRNNPISLALQTVTDILLADSALDRERHALDSFYADVRKRSTGITTPDARQKLIIILYDTFFAGAFPRTVQKHGIVYTPVEVVDFILHSVAHLLHTHFHKTLASEDVQLLDPFTGTGTFMARLLASGLIAPAHLPRVYAQQLHATEILLLPYYIAAVNIESTFAQICPDAAYTPFPGILLADTFNIPTTASADIVEKLEQDALAANNARRKRQMDSKITVIVGNPPYSVGQGSANDNNQNVSYPELDARIQTTYAAQGSATSKKSLMDSYIRAIRWASDRIDPDTGGIIGFVSNAGWLDSAATDGMRKCLVEEFSSLYIFHLRGDIRSEIRGNVKNKKEGGNVFGQGSTTGVAISLLVKTPQDTSSQAGQIHFYDIGDYLTREQKLEKISMLQSIAGIDEQGLWQPIAPDANGDWLNQRSSGFADFLAMGDIKNKNKPGNTGMFFNFSLGINTNRDAWCNNYSRNALLENMQRMVDFYEIQRATFNRQHPEASPKERQALVERFIDTDPKKISWSSSLVAHLARNKKLSFHPDAAVPTLYRPFTKGWLYYDQMLNHRVGQMPKIFPLPVSEEPAEDTSGQGGLFAAPDTPALPQAAVKNRLICVSGIGAKSFSVLMSGYMVDIQLILNGQCFPEYLYDANGKRKEAITDAALNAFQTRYGQDGAAISKTQLFEYIYAVLHSPQYRQTWANNLIKELPRIPFAASFKDFCTFAEAGKQLADLHTGFETAPMDASVTIDIHKKSCTTLDDLQPEDFIVEKMKPGKTGKDKDPAVIHVNRHITLRNIPLAAYDYVVNGRPAIDWVIDRQCIRTDKASGIVSNANRYALETLDNPRYPLELLLRIITVSLKTQAIVQTLPTLGATPDAENEADHDHP